MPSKCERLRLLGHAVGITDLAGGCWLLGRLVLARLAGWWTQWGEAVGGHSRLCALWPVDNDLGLGPGTLPDPVTGQLKYERYCCCWH